MKRFTRKIFPLGVVLLLAGLGAVWLYQRQGTRNPTAVAKSSHWCLREEDCIEEVIFRDQIQEPEGHKSSDLFFLSVREHSDPHNEVISRLAGSSYRIKPISQSVDAYAVIKDRETGEAGVILTVGKVTWVDKTRVEVAVSAYSGFGDAKGYVYELSRGEIGWTVTNRRFAFET